MPSLAKYILAALLLLGNVCFGQLTGAHTYTINADGTSPQILSLHLHSRGYFLVGTTAGLYRFDGSFFTPFSFNKEVQNKSITAIGEDKYGGTWVGFHDGNIGFAKNKVVEVLQAEEGHPAVAITSIAADSAGRIYFGTAGEGIYYYHKKRFFNINADDKLSDNYVYHLLLSNSGLLASTDRGINTIRLDNDKKQVTAFTSANGLPDNIVRALYPKKNKQSTCWVGMQDKGAGSYTYSSTGAGTFIPLINWSFGQVNSLLSTDKQLWVATEDNGIVMIRFRDSSMTDIAQVKAENNGYTKANNLTKDAEGNVWFTSNHQLIKTNGARLQNIIPFDEKTYAQIHTVLADRAGNIWVNLNEGLRKYVLNKSTGEFSFKNYLLPQINTQTDITCLYEDPYGHIWAGTLGKGIIIIDPLTGRNRNITEDNLLVEGSVLSISGKENNIWISSLGGAVHCRLSDENKDISKKYVFQNFNQLSGIGSNYIYSVYTDSRNRTWFATDGKGITVLENGRFKNFSSADGIKSLVIYSICEDRNGNIWFSALNNGVYKYEGKKFRNISTEQGLNDATITALETDITNNIIAVSKKGINIINANTNHISYLDRNQDLDEINNDLNCITSFNDAIYIVSEKGLMRYIPTQETLVTKTVLEGVQLYLSDISINQQQKFSYDENNFTFSYLGISYSHPDKVRYQYKVEGVTNEWVTTKDNNINIPKLPPGKYTFHVRSSINNSFSNSNEVTYSFVIKKPFWFQWWFIILLLAVLALSFYLYVKSRERAVKRWEGLEKEKIQSQFETLKSQVNPHFLFNSFNTLISVIEEDQESAVEYVEHLSDLYRKIVTYRDKDIITIKEEIDIIEDYFFIQKKRFGQNLQFVNHISNEDQVQYYIAPLTLQLLTENAVKHNAISAATPLVIELMIEGKSLIVRNNINLKMTKESGAGMGLQNIQKRYRLLSKQDVIINQNSEYFIVQIPLLKTPV